MLKYLKLPFTWDVPKLQQEVQSLATDAWKLHYNKKHYEGDWSIIPLHSVNGAIENLFSIQTQTHIKYAPTIFLENCMYIKELLNTLECEKTSVRLMQLAAGASIKPHSDYDMSFEDGEVRFHIPVITHEAVQFFILDEYIPMQQGESWYLNLSLTHSVNNNSTINRIHLVIDCKVNDWVKNIFALPHLIKKEVEEKELQQKFSPDVHLKIIEELRKQNTEASNKLADDLLVQHKEEER
jgi:aspartyl/asparaginyl beta-hydroxylase (cupin superfamily)